MEGGEAEVEDFGDLATPRAEILEAVIFSS